MIRLLDLYEGTGIRAGALEFLYELMKERQTEPEVNISNHGLPTFEHHRAFWTRRPYRVIHLIEAIDFKVTAPKLDWSDAWIGYVSATQRNELGIVLLKAWRGHGFGSAALRAFMTMHQPLEAVPGERSAHWLANINPANERSIATFGKLGFKLVQQTYELKEE
jgi:RimJ/RimL family protein N-acetyltransferase